MKLGYIDYLNCYPFYYSMFERETLKGVAVIPGYPGELNRMMASRDLDMSPISAATYADIQGDALLLPEFCLSSVGYVGSVILVSRFPIEALDGKRVGLSCASHTSAVLLRILFKRYYKINPVYLTARPRPSLDDLDAAMVIGNDAMHIQPAPAKYIYDLGDLWLHNTGFPVVFALFAIRERCIEGFLPQIRDVIESYHISLACLQTDKAQVVFKAKERYPDVMYDISNYYKLLKFKFTEELKDALTFYFSVASEEGLLKKIDRLRFFSPEDAMPGRMDSLSTLEEAHGGID